MQDDGKGQIFTGRRMQHERRGRCPLTPTSFSCLDTGKRMRKENQGIRDAGQFGRVPDFFVVHLSFSVVSGRAQKNTPHKRPGRGDLIYL